MFLRLFLGVCIVGEFHLLVDRLVYIFRSLLHVPVYLDQAFSAFLSSPYRPYSLCECRQINVQDSRMADCRIYVKHQDGFGCFQKKFRMLRGVHSAVFQLFESNRSQYGNEKQSTPNTLLHCRKHLKSLYLPSPKIVRVAVVCTSVASQSPFTTLPEQEIKSNFLFFGGLESVLVVAVYRHSVLRFLYTNANAIIIEHNNANARHGKAAVIKLKAILFSMIDISLTASRSCLRNNNIASIVLPYLLCEKSHLVGEPCTSRCDRNARGCEEIGQAAILVGKLPSQHDFISEGVLDLGYAPNPSIENDVLQTIGDFGTRDDLKQTQRHFERVAQVVLLAENFQFCDKIRIGVGRRIKHSGLLGCWIESAVSMIKYHQPFVVAPSQRLVRTGSVYQHAFSPFRLLNSLRGFGFSLHYLLLSRLYFIVRLGRILEKVFYRAQDFVIERSVIIQCTLIECSMQIFCFVREAKCKLSHAVSVTANSRFVNPRFSGWNP